MRQSMKCIENREKSFSLPSKLLGESPLREECVFAVACGVQALVGVPAAAPRAGEPVDRIAELLALMLDGVWWSPGVARRPIPI